MSVFAKLHMNEAVGLSEAAFGLGAGLFFIGYFLFEVPSTSFGAGWRASLDRPHHDHLGNCLGCFRFYSIDIWSDGAFRMKGFFTVFVCCLAHVRRGFSPVSFSI